MEVSISANTIQQVINADVINIDQVKKLSTEEQNEIIDKLIKTIEQQSKNLEKEPNGISSTNISKLAESINIMKELTKSSEDTESRKNQMSEILKDIKNSLGSTAGILFNAIKIAQILGIQ